MNNEMKSLVQEYEKRLDILKEKENILLVREDELNNKQKEIDERLKEIRKEEILIAARKSELSRNESTVDKKDQELEKERINIKEREKEAKKQKKEAEVEKEEYQNLKNELENQRQDIKIKNQNATENESIASELKKQAETIYEKAKIIDDEIKKKEEEFERKRVEIENSLKEKIDEYDRKIKDIEKASETLKDINFDNSEDGKQAKIVVKEAIRQAIKTVEDVQKVFSELNEKYCEGTFRGFATPIEEIDTGFEELKAKFTQIDEHAKENGLYNDVTEWLNFIEECIINASEEKDKWEFSECYRNIIFGLASCKNYELLIKILSSWSDQADGEEDSTSTDEFVNYYEILNIKEDATDDEIKKAYRKLSKKYHPDTSKDKSEEEQKEAEDMFRLITKAKEILLNKETREKFDEELKKHKE